MGKQASFDSLARLVYAVTAATMAVAVVPAAARVGVTSETDGDPTGKPPTEAEHLLRVGIDIQADELITTRDNDRAHVVFLDGTSLTVAPNAQLKVDRFVYDPVSKTGEIAVSVTTGVFRLVGGKISKSRPIIVTTPSASIGLRGGIGLFAVDSRETRAQFLFGVSMTVTANGHTETAQRPGSQILARTGAFPGAPAMIPVGGATAALSALESRAGGNDTRPDGQVIQSGFSDHNSGQAVRLPQAPLPTLRTDNVTQALSNTIEQRAPITAATTVPAATTLAMAPPFTPPLATPASSPNPRMDAWWRREERHRFDWHFNHDRRQGL